MKQGRQTRNAQLARLTNHIRNVYVKRDRTWIVLFPEGGFLCNRKESSQTYVYGPVLCLVIHYIYPSRVHRVEQQCSSRFHLCMSFHAELSVCISTR